MSVRNVDWIDFERKNPNKTEAFEKGWIEQYQQNIGRKKGCIRSGLTFCTKLL